MKRVICSAPAKVHLLGEHTVVYGKPALLSTLDKRIYVKIQEQKKEKTQNKKKKIRIFSPENDFLIRESLKIFQKAFNVEFLPAIEITVTSQIPVGCGLGSSAALSAALFGGLMKFIKNLWNPNKINNLTYEAEKIAHGFPSGADNTTVVFGGLIWFRSEFPFLKSIWSLPISVYKIPPFIFFDSGRPKETTKEMVSLVGSLYAKRRKIVEEIFNDQEKQTKRLLLALREDDKKELIRAIKKGERNLEKLNVVGRFAQGIIREIEKIGGAAKICGAGGKKEGSGMILCYHQEIGKMEKLLEKFKREKFLARLGGEGIRIEAC